MNRNELHDRLVQSLADYYEDTFQLEKAFQADLISDDELIERVIARDEVAINEILKATDEWYTRHVRTCRPYGEWERLSQTQEYRQLRCDCGVCLGTDERVSFPFAYESKANLPKYCSNCGAKVVRDGS